MKLLPILLIWMLTVCTAAFAQSKLPDSLQQKLDRAHTDINKTEVLNAIASDYESDPVMMSVYSKKAIDLARKKKLAQPEADGWRNLGNADILQSQYADALKCFTNAQSIYEGLVKLEGKDAVKHKAGLANVYGSIGIVCSEQNNYAKALEYYFKALKLFQETGQEEIVAVVYNNVGTIYEGQKEYGKALEYFNKALWLQKKNNSLDSAVTISNIGKIYLAQDNDDEALATFREAEQNFKGHKNLRGEAELYNNMGNYYKKIHNTGIAKQYFTKALDIFTTTGESYGASASLAFLGSVSVMEGNNNEAIAYFEKSSALGQEIGVPEQVKQSEKELSEVYEKMGNPAEALKHYKKYSAARDNINTAENIKSMVREEMNYEFERKEAMQKVQNEKREVLFSEQAKRYRLQTVFACLITLLLFGIAFLIYNRLQLKKRLTLQRDLAEYEQKALHLQMNPHFVFNCLGSISSFIVQNGTDQAIKYLSKFSKLMRLTLEYSKESLIPVDREIEGLQNYLELEQLRFNRMFEFSITKDPNIEDDMAIPPLLLQPFVENAIIHGIVPKKEYGSISIDFALSGEKLICTVIDNGLGIDYSRKLKENSVTVHKSLALEITKKRLEVIQAVTTKPAKVEIHEITNNEGLPAGTKIVLHLPVQYSSN